MGRIHTIHKPILKKTKKILTNKKTVDRLHAFSRSEYKEAEQSKRHAVVRRQVVAIPDARDT